MAQEIPRAGTSTQQEPAYYPPPGRPRQSFCLGNQSRATNRAPQLPLLSGVVVGTEYLDSLTIKANRDRPMLEKIRGQKEGKRRCAKEEEKNEEHAALARRPTNKTAIPGRKAVGWMRQ